MIILRDIDTLRDGGSIIIKLWMTTSDLQKFDMAFDQSGHVTILVDYSSNTSTPGVWYNGIKYASSKQITNEAFKKEVLKQLDKKIEREQFYLHKLLNDRPIYENKS